LGSQAVVITETEIVQVTSLPPVEPGSDVEVPTTTRAVCLFFYLFPELAGRCSHDETVLTGAHSPT
jgi:hypothetical protein